MRDDYALAKDLGILFKMRESACWRCYLITNACFKCGHVGHMIGDCSALKNEQAAKTMDGKLRPKV